jgi:hypothetical protein
MLSLVSTTSLEPEPVPLDVKVVLVGEREVYHLLDALDPDFPALFKIAAEWEDDLVRAPGRDLAYARLIATLARSARLRPLRRDAVAAVLDRACRWAGDRDRLSTQVGPVTDLLREADAAALAAGRDVVVADDVRTAVAAQERRDGRVRERVLDELTKGTFLVDTDGARVGQVNGLAVVGAGRAPFGRPSRITAKVRLGKGEVVDVEREVELGGPLHSKGVMILAAFLGARYATDHPLSLAATLVFEQSYGPVDGDSASSAEAYALLSALADVPLSQAFAVTGSLNQHGEVQAVGGLNEDRASSRSARADSRAARVLSRGNVHLVLTRGCRSIHMIRPLTRLGDLATAVREAGRRLPARERQRRRGGPPARARAPPPGPRLRRRGPPADGDRAVSPDLRRVLVALDASASSRAALEAAVRWARRGDGEVVALFVEDDDLLRLAAWPRALAFPGRGGAPCELDPVRWGASARRRPSAAARRGDRAHAGPRPLRVDARARRPDDRRGGPRGGAGRAGPPDAGHRARDPRHDGRRDRRDAAGGPAPRRGRDARAADRRRRGRNPAGRAALAFADSLARRLDHGDDLGLRVNVVPASDGRPDPAAEAALTTLVAAGGHPTVHRVRRPDPASVAAAARLLGAHTTVLPRSLTAGPDATAWVTSAPGAVVVVDGAPSSRER